MSEQRKKLRLGELLIQQGLVTPDQLGIALAEQKQNNIPIGRQLVRLGFITEAAIRDIMARTVGQESIDLAQVVADPEALKLVPQDFARRHRVLPIAYNTEERQLTIATTEIFNVVALDQLRASLGAGIEIKTQLAGEAQLEDYFDQFYGTAGEEYTQPMVRLVNALLVDAVKRGASDIHFEPEYAFLRIRYRIDGVLETVRSLHKTYMPGITVRIKVISEMNIAETRAPQDGRISLTLNGRPIDFRVSTHPTVHGENIVLRILDREKSIISLDKMNLPPQTMLRLNLMLARPEGILIVTGPTGSGKTTTLYSLLSQMNDESVNIMTLEDPVEYPLTLMRQTSVNDAVRMDFANGIRSMMRQDPDIILVGEIRDRDTAEMAFRAAMTGHQVFSTLHSNSALGAFPRLLDIGIQPDIMAGNIIGVVAQRLVRTLCLHCKEAYMPTPEERTILGTGGTDVEHLYRPVGCTRCDNKGFKGRRSVMELLLMDVELDELVARRATAKELRTAAMANNFRPLAEEAIALVLNGTSSLAEISRTIDLTGRFS